MLTRHSFWCLTCKGIFTGAGQLDQVPETRLWCVQGQCPSLQGVALDRAHCPITTREHLLLLDRHVPRAMSRENRMALGVTHVVVMEDHLHY